MAMEISSIGSGFLARRSWISRGYRYRELGLSIQGIRANTASESKPHVSSRIAFPRC